jgi:hypothetical protein
MIRIDRYTLRYQPVAFWWVGLSALSMVIGVFGPWLSAVGGATIVSGLHGRGWAVLGCGVAGLAVLAALYAEARRARWGLALACAAGLAGAYLSWTAYESIPDAPSIAPYGDLFGPGWGLVACLGASLSLAAAAGYSLFKPPEDWR